MPFVLDVMTLDALEERRAGVVVRDAHREAAFPHDRVKVIWDHCSGATHTLRIRRVSTHAMVRVVRQQDCAQPTHSLRRDGRGKSYPHPSMIAR